MLWGEEGLEDFYSCCDKIYLIPHKAPQHSYDNKNIYTIPPLKPPLTPPHPLSTQSDNGPLGSFFQTCTFFGSIVSSILSFLVAYIYFFYFNWILIFTDTSSGIQYGHATVTSSHMMLICDDVGASWRDLGTQLRLPSAVVRNVENDYTLCRERAWQVLDRWKQRNGTGATLGNLTDALEKIGKRNAAQRLVGM